MPVGLADFQPLLTRDGPITVVHASGHAVTHAPSGIANAVEPNTSQVLTLPEIHIALFDELGRPIKAIRGDQIIEINATSPGWQLVVDDSGEPYDGTRIATRRA